MIIHAHELPKSKNRPYQVTLPLFYTYDQLIPDTWDDTEQSVPCWSTGVDGLQLGLQWTEAQRLTLAAYTAFKTYELIRDVSKQSWIGVERVGYILPEGFLPIRVTYRKADEVQRLLMPGNVGYLYNHTLGLTQAVCAGISPRLQFVLDVDTYLPAHNYEVRNYKTVQEIVPEFINNGPHLSWDIRTNEYAKSDIKHLSQWYDVLGNAEYAGVKPVVDWVRDYVEVRPPSLDIFLRSYPCGPIPMATLRACYTNGAIDTTVPEPLVLVADNQRPIPDVLVQKLLELQTTDFYGAFPVESCVVQQLPGFHTIQNRFGSYFQVQANPDLSLIREILQDLLSTFATRDMLIQCVYLRLTCNEEVEIIYSGLTEGRKSGVWAFYANLNDVTASWYGVAQSPIFKNRH